MADAMVRMVLLPFFAVAAASWWLMGDLVEPGGEDVILGLGWIDEHDALVGLLGVGLGIVAALALTGRPVMVRSLVLAVIAGIVMAGSVRLVTARSVGANIGGGMAMMVAPPLVVGLLVAAAWTVGRDALSRKR